MNVVGDEKRVGCRRGSEDEVAVEEMKGLEWLRMKEEWWQKARQQRKKDPSR